MSEKPLDAKIIKKTQDTLGKIIKKPPLTEKLLSKPPFKFLHDIMTSVIRSTGFMKGLFTDTEMDSENVKDKETKVIFLQKAIDMVSLVTGKPIAAKPSKIVAGHDPDRTNEFLQALAESINKKVDNDDYVRRVLKTEDVKPSSKKERESSKSKDKDESKDESRKSKDRGKEDGGGGDRKSKDRGGEDEKGGEHRSDRHRSKDRHRDRSKENEDGNRESKHRDKDKDRDKDREERHRSRENGEKDGEQSRDKDKDKDKERDKDKDRHRDRKERGDGDRKDREKEERKHEKKDDDRGDRKDRKRHEEREDKHDTGEDNEQLRLQRPTSAKGARRRHGRADEDRNDDDSKLSASRKAPARPGSARPAPPKPKKSEATMDDAVISGGLGRPNVIVDKRRDSDDDDDEFVTKEEDLPPPPEPAPKPRGVAENAEEDGDHGGLVKKILETKKELESNTQPSKKTEIDRSQAMSDATRRKERELVQKEIDRLRTSIQVLTRSVNPLGKILDFLQEDLDAMQKELDVYRVENKENAVALQREQSLTDSAVGPLKAQLLELESAISDQVDLIAAVKATIGHNDVKVTKILGTLAAKS